MAESGEDRAMCVTSHPGYTPHREQLGIGYIFPDPESELETQAKARREKQTSEHLLKRFDYLTIQKVLPFEHRQWRH